MYSGGFFRVRCIVRHVIEVRKSGMPCFLRQSLQLSTIVLNDEIANTILSVHPFTTQSKIMQLVVP